MCSYEHKNINIFSVQRWIMFRGRRRRGRRGRKPAPVYIGQHPTVKTFIPQPYNEKPPIIIEPAELEAVRLVDFEGATQEEAGKQMRISRGTVWRLLQEARRKIVQALLEGRRIEVSLQP
jgi:predicted DNA-binding protein (UPF0251 family)